MVPNAALDMLGTKPLINAHVAVSGFLDKTVVKDVRLLRMASTVSPYETVAMPTVTLFLDVNVECQRVHILPS